MAEDWFAENLRLTFFGVKGWTQRQVFAEIAGVPPAQINIQPQMHTHQEMGDFSNAYLAITQQVDRIDVVLTDQPTRNTIDNDAPNYKPMFWIGPFHESIGMFDALSAKATPLVPSATRLAYAITLVRQTKTVNEAVGCLKNYLPTIDFDPNDDTDLVFQINRRRKDEDGRLINRLGRWEAIQMMTMRVGIGVGLPPPLPSRSPTYAARIYADISTDVDNMTPFGRSEIAKLVDKLRAHALALAETGDRK